MPVQIVELPKRGEEAVIKATFPRYFEILEGKARPRFHTAKLNEKVKEAFRLLENCELCEWHCKVNRKANQKGRCQLSDKMLLSSYFAHSGEEWFLVPSFTIFFWSCNFQCQYCQNWAISQRFEKPKQIGEARLAAVIDRQAAAMKCKNINFVGGEPTPQLPFILKTLSHVKSSLPIVWNSNFYMSEASMKLLSGVIDVYLSDFKYGNDDCALRLSKVGNYLEPVKRNHLLAAADAELLIRHLLLPGHIECCTKPILEWIAKHIKEKAIINIMDQYRPEYKAAEYRELRRFISQEEVDAAVEHAKKLKLRFIT